MSLTTRRIHELVRFLVVAGTTLSIGGRADADLLTLPVRLTDLLLPNTYVEAGQFRFSGFEVVESSTTDIIDMVIVNDGTILNESGISLGFGDGGFEVGDEQGFFANLLLRFEAYPNAAGMLISNSMLAIEGGAE